MDTNRAAMEKVLKEHCVPFLRELGFKGGFPDFYRNVDGFISLLNFQFFSSGGSFCVNISFADRQRDNIYFKKDTEPKSLKVSQARKQARLGAPNLVGDHWFSFGKTSYDEYRGEPQDPSDIARKVNGLVSEAALPWWAQHES